LASALPTQQNEAFVGWPDHKLAPEIWEVHTNALPGLDVEKVATTDPDGEDLGKHNPPLWALDMSKMYLLSRTLLLLFLL
jgi:hypothetical protein